MPNEKPDGLNTPQPTDAGAPAAPGQVAPTADQTSNFLESLSEDGKNYLRGLGIEALDAESFAKVIDSSIKQKSSVSEKSRELEELRARLASQGQSLEPAPAPAAEEEPAPTPVATPSPSSQVQGVGVTENDLFDLSSMITREFPELIPEAADGRVFAELRQLGFFGAEGINKKAVYEHLSAKHSLAKELAELRAFKEENSQPDPSANPSYNPYTQEPTSGTKDATWARDVVAASINGKQVDERLLGEARQILQSAI